MSWGTKFPKAVCSVDSCSLPIKGHGFCNKHYQLFKRNGSPEKLVKNSRHHPLYITWFEKKQNKRLCEEWLTFKVFCEAVGKRPEGNFVLKRLNPNLPYGPDNFEWYEHLKKEEDESNKDWWARKWADARARNPDVEYERNLQRNFGISLEQYIVKFNEQNGKCAICNQPEVLLLKSGISKRLAVDHCHNSNKIRELLCNRCNVTIGMTKDSIELLEKMIAYLIKHKEN